MDAEAQISLPVVLNLPSMLVRAEMVSQGSACWLKVLCRFADLAFRRRYYSQVGLLEDRCHVPHLEKLPEGGKT